MATTTRKPVQLDHHHFGVPPDDPAFNIDAARRAHADVMRRWDDPKDGDAYKAMLLHAIQDATAAEIDRHHDEIQAFLDDFGKRQSRTLAKAVVKSWVGMHTEIAKDSAFERLHHRGQGGQFATMTEAQMADTDTRRALLTHVAGIAQAMEGREQKIRYRIEDKKGNIREQVLPRTHLPKLKSGEKLADRPRGAGIGGDVLGGGEHLNMGEQMFNLVQALGGSAGAAGHAARGSAAGLKFGQEWDAHQHRNYGSDVGAGYSRIKAGADALHTIAGGNPKAQAAVAVGRFVGQHGPEAEKVLGPHARRKAYQYRGVERAPKNLPKKEGEGDYRDRLTARISGHIPTRTVHDLNLASGYTAPSHGYLLNDKGDVTTEAHGYGDDHYLPFKLSGLHKLKNGSYVRTRSTGGPTTEDIYAASISGAKDFTVASRQGTYTLGFDPEFTHNKRFGDIALGMSRRYGKILDAVKGGNVRLRGEMSDQQYQHVYEGKYAEAEKAGDQHPDVTARTFADKARTQQEEGDGRELSLDGEGYDYALQSLASQYPYYLHYGQKVKGTQTGYSRPGDPRFFDKDEEGGHFERIGNANEKDSGYVKPRHIKAAGAQVGYFDPTIAGETKRPGSNEGSRTGKISGDQAFHQNWSHNPYNPARHKIGGGYTENRDQREDDRSRPSTPSAPQGTPSSERSGSARMGSTKPETDMTPDGWEMWHRVMTIKEKAGDDHGLAPSMAHQEGFADHWNGTAKNAKGETHGLNDHDRLTQQVEAAERRNNITPPRMTDAPTGHSDENPDTDAAKIAQSADAEEHNRLRGLVEADGTQDLRNRITDAAVKLKDEGHEGLNSESSTFEPSEDWSHYNAWQEAGDDIAGKLSARDQTDAPTLIGHEDALGKLENRLGVAEESKWSPKVEPEPEDTSEVEADEANTPGAKNTAALQTSMLSGLSDASAKASGNPRVKELIDDAIDQWNNVEASTGAGMSEANDAVGRLLKLQPQVGEMRVAVQVPGGGHQEHKLKDVYFGKRWTVSKRGSQWIVKRLVA